MTLNKLMIAILFILSCSTLHADTVAYYFPQPAGTLQAGVTGKKAGDIISLYTDADVAERCDFNKQIVVTRTSVLCAYNGKVPNAGP